MDARSAGGGARRRLGPDREQIGRAFETLEQGHVLVLHPDTREVAMAMPFSAGPTPFKVIVGDSFWWAN